MMPSFNSKGLYMTKDTIKISQAAGKEEQNMALFDSSGKLITDLNKIKELIANGAYVNYVNPSDNACKADKQNTPLISAAKLGNI